MEEAKTDESKIIVPEKKFGNRKLRRKIAAWERKSTKNTRQVRMNPYKKIALQMKDNLQVIENVNSGKLDQKLGATKQIKESANE